MTQSNLLNTVAELPEPEMDALSQSNQLREFITNLINSQSGSIGFDEYMSAALYEPGLGYYSAGSRKFGPDGDFITAPEISALYSRCLARQCAQVLENLEQGVILELGAGTGCMAKDIMLELERINSLPGEYQILEVSADLKQRQQSLLKESIPQLYDHFIWLDSLPDELFSGLILANEVLDALPVKRFKKTSGTFKEMKVGVNKDQFCWIEADAIPELFNQLDELEKKLPNPFPEQYVSEINTGLTAWLDSFANILKEGVIFFIDYGYSRNEFYHPQRKDGSLLCHYRHRAHADPFIYPGLQDITASVDFTALAECAHSSGLRVSGYTSQAYFLMACGLDEMTADLTSMDIKTQTKIAQQIRTLTLPAEMGERFKVMALTKEYDQTLMSFSVMDQRARL